MRGQSFDAATILCAGCALCNQQGMGGSKAGWRARKDIGSNEGRKEEGTSIVRGWGGQGEYTRMDKGKGMLHAYANHIQRC